MATASNRVVIKASVLKTRQTQKTILNKVEFSEGLEQEGTEFTEGLFLPDLRTQ